MWDIPSVLSTPYLSWYSLGTQLAFDAPVLLILGMLHASAPEVQPEVRPLHEGMGSVARAVRDNLGSCEEWQGWPRS